MTELISALQTPHALITLSVLGLAVVLFITGALAPELTGLLSLGLLLACGVLSPQEALAGFGSPALITLLGSLTSFSVALQTTGLADALAAGLQQWLHGWPIYYALLAIFLGTTLLTQVMSNAASVALLITVLFGASQSFLTPVGYQTNLMVFGTGRYRFLDVTRFSLGLTLIMTGFIPALILTNTGRTEA